MSGRILAICMSTKKHEAKKAVDSAEALEGQGLAGDAHLGFGHRQVSLLADERVDEMRAQGLELEPGAFGENLLTRDFDLASVALGDRLQVGSTVELEVTQLGKECHSPCAIFEQVGTCIMPTTGVFCKVVTGGPLKPGDSLVRLPD